MIFWIREVAGWLLIALGLILFVITFIVLAIAKLMLLRLQRQAGG